MRKTSEVLQSIVMAVKLNVAERKERVLIGPVSDVRGRLEGADTQSIIFDKERCLGQLVFEFETQDAIEWNEKVIYPMVRALRNENSVNIWESPLWDLMIEKLDSENAVEVYTAYNAYIYYNAERQLPLGKRVVDVFERRMTSLVQPYCGVLFDGIDEGMLTFAQKKLDKIIQRWRYRAEVDLIIWFPSNGIDMEVAVSENDLLPMMIYYLRQMQDCGCKLQICGYCGNRFWAPSGHYVLCSEECGVEQKKANEKAYQERGKANKYDHAYKMSTQRMRRLLEKYKKRDDISAAQIAEAYSVYDRMREDAKKRKKNIKTKEEYVSFRDWLFEQEARLDHMCGGV